MKLQTKSLEALKAERKALLDSDAEDVRQMFVTPGSAQAFVYAEKRAEADLFFATGRAHPDSHLALEAAARGLSESEMASVYLRNSDRWKRISAVIEVARISAKRAVDESSTPETVISASKVDWMGILNEDSKPN